MVKNLLSFPFTSAARFQGKSINFTVKAVRINAVHSLINNLYN